MLGASGYGLTLGWDCTGTVNMLGATAIAGRLLGLNEQQMVNALGIVTNQLAGSFQIIWDATTAFKLPQGLSARNGVFSHSSQRPAGRVLADSLLGKFGKDYQPLTPKVVPTRRYSPRIWAKEYFADSTFKPYPCCRGGHAAIDCALSLLAERQVDPDDVDEMVLYVPKRDIGAFIGQPFTMGDSPLHGSAAFNFRYLVACAIAKREREARALHGGVHRDPGIASLAERTRLAELEDAPLVDRETRAQE